VFKNNDLTGNARDGKQAMQILHKQTSMLQCNMARRESKLLAQHPRHAKPLA
jgi:hypothetical protein